MYKYLLFFPLCFLTMLSCAQNTSSFSLRESVLRIETIDEKSDLSVLGEIPYYESGWSDTNVSVDDERLLRFFDIPADKIELTLDNESGTISDIDITFFEKDHEVVLSLLREKFGKENKPEADYNDYSEDELIWKVKNTTYQYNNSSDSRSLYIKFEKERGVVYEY